MLHIIIFFFLKCVNNINHFQDFFKILTVNSKSVSMLKIIFCFIIKGIQIWKINFIESI